MTDRKSLNRRSFLSRVAGGAVLGGGALSLVSGSAAFAITDHDPSDPSNRTGITDRDSTDRPGNGTGGATIHNGNSDNDANDAAGHPRGSTSPARRNWKAPA